MSQLGFPQERERKKKKFGSFPAESALGLDAGKEQMAGSLPNKFCFSKAMRPCLQSELLNYSPEESLVSAWSSSGSSWRTRDRRNF